MQKKSLISSVMELREKGYRIKFRTRSDGGIIVQSINGKRFTGAEGNRIVRELSGNVLSEARERQLASNVSEFIRGQHTKKAPIEADLKKELRKAQALWRKRGLAEKGQGRILMKNVRKRIAREGMESAIQSLRNIERYARGYAYEENVTLLASRVSKMQMEIRGDDAEAQELRALVADTANYIMNKKDDFLEEWIEPINNEAYDRNKSVRERIVEIRRILGI